jgi:phospholipid:diacylglycerol acyltransferase
LQTELFKRVYKEKVLLAAHSWGDNVARAFLHWMEEQQPGWVDEHIAVHFNLAGPVLGVPKSLTSLLSGAEFHVSGCLICA